MENRSRMISGKTLEKQIDWLSENWDQPDEGIWEVRGGKKSFFIQDCYVG